MWGQRRRAEVVTFTHVPNACRGCAEEAGRPPGLGHSRAACVSWRAAANASTSIPYQGGLLQLRPVSVTSQLSTALPPEKRVIEKATRPANRGEDRFLRLDEVLHLERLLRWRAGGGCRFAQDPDDGRHDSLLAEPVVVVL